MAEDDSEFVTLAEVKKLLEEESEERELRYEQSLALSHAEKFVELSVEDIEELMDELRENFDFMDEELIYKTADILPDDEEGVRSIFQQDRYTPSTEEAEEIINTIKKYK
ncbi:MAG: hypothetical protein KGY76_04305 [Candidatus Thermoplasmatota archaeon]|nr:hypothetical protein [Candidatus Thermoplasmatota archaeon]